MKDGMPSREWSKGKEAKPQPSMKEDAKTGVAHLHEHHKEREMPMDRSYATGNPKGCK